MRYLQSQNISQSRSGKRHTLGYSVIIRTKDCEAEIMERVTFMQEETIEENNSITKEQKDIVAYWYRVLLDTDSDHCNTYHLHDVLEHLKRLRNPPCTNVATLFWLVHENLIYICDELHVGIKEEMRTLTNFETYVKLMRISYRY